MSIFDNNKLKKTISVILASLSLGGAAGCKKVEDKSENDISDIKMVNKTHDNQNDKYKEALESLGAEIVEEEPSEEREQLKEIDAQKKEDELKKAITGITQKDKLMEVLENKDWGEQEEKLILELYDIADRNYDLREINNPKEKQMYLKNLVDTIRNVNVIKLDPSDSVLEANGWSARADYNDKSIVMKFNNTNDLAHELAHMNVGTFLNRSYSVDLGFVLEEGRASCFEGDALEDTEWIDNIPIDVNKRFGEQLLIENSSGSYPAFEEIYKNFISLGVNMEGMRREALSVEELTKQIGNQLNHTYGEDLGSRYIESVRSYIEFFDMHGHVCVEENQLGQSVLEAREYMLALQEKCTEISRNNQLNKDMGYIR